LSNIGHNSVAADQLRLFMERIERLQEEKKGLADDIRDVFAEAKANGYDTKAMREVLKLRAMETHVRQERDALIETYRQALGIDYAATPLGRSALERATGDFSDHLSRMDDQGIGVSIGIPGEAMTPLNKTAAENMEKAK
jgi:uncharacterized protein (UPF0335 family)